jgi:hypothetical protein
MEQRLRLGDLCHGGMRFDAVDDFPDCLEASLR